MKRQLNTRDLTQGTVWKVLILFFIPIAAGTCIQQLYNAVDGLIVGRFVGTGALASVGGSSTQIINLLIGFFVAATAGSSVVISQIYGAGRYEDVKNASGCAISVFALLGLVLTVFGVIASPAVLALLKTPAETIPGASLYLRIYFLGVPFILVLNMESNMLRAVGDSFWPFIFMIVGCITNIILDIIFVIGFGWGIAGAAAATVAAQIINMALLTHRLIKTREDYRLSFRHFQIHRIYLKNILNLGVPAGAQSSMYSISNMIIQIGVNSLGTVVVASWAMTSKTDGIFWAVSNALGAAITSFIGQNLGAGRVDRVRECIKQSLVLAGLINLFLSAAIMAAAIPLLHILTNDEAVIQTTFRMMTYFVPFYLIWTVIEVLSAILRGAGDILRPFLIISLGICIFRIIWIVTVFLRFHTLPVLCASYPISWAVTSIAMAIYFRRGKWLDRGEKIIG